MCIRDRIKFIHEADTEAKKLELFKKVRRGDVRILMGSTQKMGAGTNVQNKHAADVYKRQDTSRHQKFLPSRNGRCETLHFRCLARCV